MTTEVLLLPCRGCGRLVGGYAVGRSWTREVRRPAGVARAPGLASEEVTLGSRIELPDQVLSGLGAFTLWERDKYGARGLSWPVATDSAVVAAGSYSKSRRRCRHYRRCSRDQAIDDLLQHCPTPGSTTPPALDGTDEAPRTVSTEPGRHLNVKWNRPCKR
jgi:hypothetical protein